LTLFTHFAGLDIRFGRTVKVSDRLPGEPSSECWVPREPAVPACPANGMVVLPARSVPRARASRFWEQAPRKRDPLSAAARLGLSRSYSAAGDLQEAEAAIKKAIDLGPSTGFVHGTPCGLMRS